jgi:hypothetical protein
MPCLFALLAVGWALQDAGHCVLKASGWLFVAGYIIFSGSPYVLSLSGALAGRHHAHWGIALLADAVPAWAAERVRRCDAPSQTSDTHKSSDKAEILQITLRNSRAIISMFMTVCA